LVKMPGLARQPIHHQLKETGPGPTQKPGCNQNHF
jgi:hypothetical protein